MQESVKKKVRRLYADIEWTAPYAKYHQEWKWQTKRKFIELSEKTKNAIMKKVQAYIYEKWGLNRRK